MQESADIRRPRLLVLASTYPRWSDDPEPGFVHELNKRLTGQFEVSVLCPHAKNAAPQDIMDGVNIRRFRYAPSNLETLVNNGGIVGNLKRSLWKWLLVPGFLFAMTWSAMREVRNQHPDVIHAHWLIPQGMVAALLQLVTRKPIPFLVTSHGGDLFALRSSPLQAIKRWVAERAAGMTVVSHAMRDELDLIGVDSTNVQVQPMGVDLTVRFTPDPSIERSHDEILFVGRLVEKKGLRYLIEAMPEILRKHPLAYLTIVGFGPEEQERKTQVAALGLQHKIHFIGAVGQSDLPALYRRVAVFVAPFVQAGSGDREGLGLVAVEAAGCGCPVIASDLPAVMDVFGTGGAVLVPPGSATNLATAVCGLLLGELSSHEPDNEFLSVLRKKFDWDAVAARYASLLAGLIPTAARHR
jgi:glycosyltransferase involved in cell wall biosynthesis